MLRIVCVAGARPNYMKVKPVMDALERHGADVVLVHTGQHYDASMSAASSSATSASGRPTGTSARGRAATPSRRAG
ncbi:hypothetical protein [Streptomyces sp. CS62]|uniref:hypothetical protein n=1 Tax=Streptomyces sp. CS62 TaxID=3119268 RepID=UPI002F925025